METEQEPKKNSRERFDEDYNQLTESEIQKELLFTQQRTLLKLENIRKNTNHLVTFGIVIPYVLTAVIVLGYIAYSTGF